MSAALFAGSWSRWKVDSTTSARRTSTVVQLNGVPQLDLDRADDMADRLVAIDRIAAARSLVRLDG